METSFYEKAVKIDSVINKFNETSFLSVRDLLKDSSLLNYLYEEICKYEDVYIYFNVLFDYGYFYPDKNPSPIPSETNKGFYHIPYWSALKVLYKVIEQNDKKNNDEINKKLHMIIESLINQKRIDNYYTDVFILKALAIIPYKMIISIKQYFEYFNKTLNSRFGADFFGSEIGNTLIPKAIEEENEELLMLTMELVFNYKKTGTTYIEYKAKIVDYWLEDIISKNSNEIYNILDVKIISYGIQKIKEIIKDDDSNYSYIEINHIERKSDFGADGFKRILLDFVRDGLISIKKGTDKKYIENLWNEKHPIFKRLVLHTINHRYDEFESVFWDNLPSDLDDYNIEHELYCLIQENSKQLSSEQITLLVELINKIESNESDSNLKLKQEASRKKEWLLTLIKTGDKRVSKMYSTVNDIIPEDINHPGEPIHTYSKYGYDRPEDIQKIENIEISKQIEYLNKVSESYTEGSRRYYKNLLMKDIENLINNLLLFKDASRPFQHSALLALSDVWRKGIDFEWENIFNFMDYLFMQDDKFWNEEYKEKDNYRDWIISISLELISEGVTDANHAFDIKHYDKAKKVLFALFNKINYTNPYPQKIAEALLNDKIGTLYSAMINLMLHNARVSKLSEGKRWDKEIKKVFENEMDRSSDSSAMFSGILGRYLINFFWIDEKWCIDNFTRIFPVDNNEELKMTMSAYLFFNSKIYTNVYNLFMKHDLFRIALKQLDDSDSFKKLIQFIVAGYIHDLDYKEKNIELLEMLINNRNIEVINEIINFCSRTKFSKDISEKVLYIWQKILKNAKDGYYEYNDSVLSNLLKFTELFEDITKIYHFLKNSIEYLEINHNMQNIVNPFKIMVNNNPSIIGELIIDMLKSKYNKFYFRDKDFIFFVETLYNKDEKDKADYICNFLGEEGRYFLKPLWLYNNSNLLT